MNSPTSELEIWDVMYERRGSISHATLDRPKALSALNRAITKELKSVFEDSRDDCTVRGVILIGSGDRAFAAGAVISEVANDTAVEAEDKPQLGLARGFLG